MEFAGLTPCESEKILGLPSNTLSSMKQRGFVAPELEGGRYSRRQLYGLYVLRGARRQGAALVSAVAAGDLLAKRPPESLAADLAAGRQFLVLIGESLTLRLVDRAKAFDLELRDRAVRENLPLVIVDVAAAVRVVDAGIERLTAAGKDLGKVIKPAWENFPSTKALGRGPSIKVG